MKRRTLLLALVLGQFLLATAPARADLLPLGAISDYFNGFRTAEGSFTQINPDGTLATGRLMISRPGRVRFEYDPPDQNLVLAAAGAVNVFDARSNMGPTVYPLSRTPLSLILAARVDLARERMVVDHYVDGPTTSVVAQDPEHPEYGHIRLVFSAAPVELRQWVVSDDMGNETTVILGDLELDARLSPGLFDVRTEIERRGLQPSR